MSENRAEAIEADVTGQDVAIGDAQIAIPFGWS